MKCKKSISLILSLAIVSATLPVVSFAENEETAEVTYKQERITVEDFDPDATQEPFENEPVTHTENVPNTVVMEEGPAFEPAMLHVQDLSNVALGTQSLSTVLSSTSDDTLWDAMMRQKFGDDYISPFKKSNGQNVSGRTNRLVIKETDLTLPGKNGLDVNIRRRHDNQNYNQTISGTNYGTFVPTSNMRKVFAFTDTSTNERVYIGFASIDEFYMYNMSGGIKITEYPTGDSAVGKITINNERVDCYYFEKIYTKKSSSGSVILTYDDTFAPKEKWINYSDGSIYGLITFTLHANTDRLGYGWELELPEANLYSYDNSQESLDDYTVYLKDYMGMFRDIDGNVYSLNGSGTLKKYDTGEYTYSSSVRSRSNGFLNITQYFAPQTVAGTNLQYNFELFDSAKGLTYYMYNTGIQADAVKTRQPIYIVAVADKFNNIIKYTYNSDYTKLTQIIDTYGRVINFTDTETGDAISYTDENGIVQTITYEKEELVSTALDNDSPLNGKAVNRFKVTNQEGEVTIYDSRETEVIVYYKNAITVPLYPIYGMDYSAGSAMLPAWGNNIERIIYPNGSETHYRYGRIFVSNQNLKTATGEYAVKESYDVIGGVQKNKKSYTFAIDNYDIVKTESNTSSGLVTKETYHTGGQLAESIASSNGERTSPYVVNSYWYADDGQLEKHTVTNSGLSKTTEYTFRENYPNMLTEEIVSGLKKTTYTYHTVDRKATLMPNITTVKGYTGSTYSTDYSVETILDSEEKYIQTERVIKNNIVEADTFYGRDPNGRVIAEFRAINDGNRDGILSGDADSTEHYREFTDNADGSVTVIDYAYDIFSPRYIPTTYRYSVTGLPISMTDPEGNTTQIEYDDVGRVRRYIYPNGATETADYNITNMCTNVKDKAGEYTFTYFSQSGQPTSKYFSNSQWRKFEECQYDSADRLTYKKSIYDVDKYTAERYTYDILGRVATRQVYDNDTLLYTESYSYAMNKTTKTTTAEDGTAVATTRETFDAYGRVTKKESYVTGTNMTTSYTYDYKGNVLTETDPMGNVTTYTYDINNNVTSVTYPDNSAESMYYDMIGREVAVLDKNSVEYRTVYDGLGRIGQTQVNANGTYVTLTENTYDDNSNLISEMHNTSPQNNTTENAKVTNYQYDNMNNLICVTYDGGAEDSVVQYSYDIAGRMTKMVTGLSQYYSDTLPETAQITQYGYDIHSNMTSKTDQLGNVKTYTYDYAGNVKSETSGNVTINKTYGPYGITSSYIDNNNTADDYTYTYNNIGMMSGHSSVYGTETITYDAFGRKTSETSNSRTHLYTYDLNSRITNYQMKYGETVENDIDYTYDNMGRTTLMELNSTGFAGDEISYAYDTSGNLTSKIQGENRTDITYNAYNQPVTYINKIDDTTTGSYSYTYNWGGNVLTENDTANNLNKSYVYDTFGNLQNETYSGAVNKSISYTYDKAFNRITEQVSGDESYTKAYTYNKRNQLLTEIKTVGDSTEVLSYQYNAKGQRIGKYITVNDTTNPVCFYSWDANGMLLYVDNGGVSPVYQYDALGRRIGKQTNVTTKYTWSGDEEMAEILGDVITDRYVYGIDGIAMMNNTYFFKNAHGDVTELVNSGNSACKYSYEAFGEKLTIPSNVNNPFQYCGEYYDVESGLIYLRNRYYDPEVGAFISEDPIQDGMNWYVYCSNNPVNFVDPLGLFDYDTQLSYSPNVYSADVLTLQNELAWNGYLTDDDIDGYFGQKTLNAVNAYKNDKGLWNFGEYEGVVGLTTWDSLGLIHRTQADIDAGVTIVNFGAKQMFDISNAVANAVQKDEAEFAQHSGDMEWFINTVKNEGRWNIKKDAKTWSTTLGISQNSYDQEMLFYGRIVCIDDIGNVAYGYLGSAAGISANTLKMGSMGYHILNHSFTKFDNEKEDQGFIQLGVSWYSGNDIQVRFGI